jgi:Fur family transcriptional regulator, ferric uptake regulator
MTHERLDYQSRMRAKGYRVTPQRQLILDSICQGNGHTTLKEIYARVQEKSPTVNQATVYRNLDFLCSLNLVVAAEVSGRRVYEIAGEEPHHHLVCRKCGKAERIDHARVRQFFESVEEAYPFHVDMDHLTLFGLCQACR